MRRRIIGLAAAICVVPTLPAAAGAVPTWSAASPLEGTAATSYTAMEANGDAAVTWVGFVAGKPTAQVATRPPGGRFSAPLDLSPAGGEARASQVAEDGAGEATVAWQAVRAGGSNYLVEAATVSGGVASAPVELSAPGQNAIAPVVAGDERGDAVIAWTRFNGTNQIVQASYRPAGGAFGPAVSVSAEGGNAAAPAVAIDGAGNATVVWERYNGANEVVEAATRPAASGKFAAAAALSNPAEGAIQPSVADNAEGDTAVVWERIGASVVTEARVRPAGGKFSTPAKLSGEGFNADHPQVALDGRGDPTVVWARTLGFTIVVEYANGTLAGTFSPPAGLAFEAWYPSIAEDAAGDTLVGYSTIISPVAAVATFRPAGGAFGGAETVSATGHAVIGGPGVYNVALSADGDGAFGFIAEEGGGVVAQESLLDVAGVELATPSIPATATAGVPVAFSAAPRDAVFGQPAVTWAFGDASSASGAAVTHTFAQPGTYSVSVTAVAAPGDEVTRTASIVVAAPPPRPASSGAPAFHAAMLVSASVAADSHGRVHLKIACPAGGAACAGTVALSLPATARVAARASGTAVTVAAGRASFAVAVGASATVSVALPSAVLGLLNRHHRLTLAATVESHGASDQSASTGAKLLVKAYTKPKKKGRKRR